MDHHDLAAGSACDADCPVRLASDVLSGRWTLLIFRELLAGTCRYTQLHHALLGISPKVLSSRLRLLEDAGLVERRVYPTVPPKTEYTLTKKGRGVEPVIMAMAAFGETLRAG